MEINMNIKCTIAYLIAALALSGCGLVEKEYVTETPEDHRVRVVLEEDNSFYADEYVAETERGGDVIFVLHEVCGRTIEGTDYRGNARITEGQDANETLLTLEHVRYSTVVSVQAKQEVCELVYHANGGQAIEENTTDPIRITVPRTHLRVNTARADELFERPGYTLVGWSLMPNPQEIVSSEEPVDLQEIISSESSVDVQDPADPEGLANAQDPSGSESLVDAREPASSESSVDPDTRTDFKDLISPGSRIDFKERIDLYAVWIPWSDAALFSYEESGDGVIITGTAETEAAETAGNPGTDHTWNFTGAAETEAAETAGNSEPDRVRNHTGTAETEAAETAGNSEPDRVRNHTGTAETEAAETAGNSGTDRARNLPETLVIPATLAGRRVYGIAEGAFAGTNISTLVLPTGLRTVGNGAFRGATVREVYLFDDLETISGHAFDECAELKTLHIGAARAPVYSGNYFDTFADKCDRLSLLAPDPKIVLFSGSSTRFGYDSRMIEEAMGKSVVNMGVFAYANALPQLLIIRESMRAGDVLLVSPEFDAAQSQFCVSRQMEPQIYAMCESDYGLVARIDFAEVTNAFGALDTFLKTRKGMTAGSYDLTAADFDEDGNPVTTPSYNEFGDYILYRPNAETEEPVYGLGVDYTPAALPKAQFIDPFNAAMEMFLERGVSVLFTYSPRNVLAVSEASTEEARAELHEYLTRNLAVPVISGIEESLYTGTYMYGTDNHLSTEGVRIRTERVIEDLRRSRAD